MNVKRLIFSVLLADYVAVTAWAVHADGWSGIVRTITAPSGIQAVSEIVLFIGIAAAYVWNDAGKRGFSRGWAALVMCTGVAGLLLYLARRENGVAPRPAEAPLTHPATQAV